MSSMQPIMKLEFLLNQRLIECFEFINARDVFFIHLISSIIVFYKIFEVFDVLVTQWKSARKGPQKKVVIIFLLV
jgi:hypothetical protein